MNCNCLDHIIINSLAGLCGCNSPASRLKREHGGVSRSSLFITALFKLSEEEDKNENITGAHHFPSH